MPERTLSMIIEGEDASGPAMTSAKNSVEELGFTVDEAGNRLSTFAERVEEGRRMVEAYPSSVGGATNSLGQFASGAGAAGAAAGTASSDLSMFTGVLRMLGYSAGVPRRSLMMLTRGIRIVGTASRTSIASMSAMSKIALGIGAAGVVGALGLAAVTKGLAGLAKRSIEAESKRVDFEEWTADAGGHVEVLGQLREATGGLVDDLTLQEDATKAVTDRTKELMDADYLLSEAEARRLALMEYDRQLIQDAVARGDRLGDSYVKMGTNVDNLGDSLGQNLAPALDSVGEAGDQMISDVTPSLETLADAMATWFTNISDKWAPAATTALGDVVTVLATLASYTLTPFKYRVEFVKERVPGFLERIGEIFAPRGAGTVAPSYYPGGAALPPAPYRAPAGPQDTRVSGHITVGGTVTLEGLGKKIDVGISKELQRVGIG